MKLWQPILGIAAIAVFAAVEFPGGKGNEVATELVKERKLILDAATKEVVAIDAVATVDQIEVKFYESDEKAAWHLVHDGVKVLALIEGPGKTWTTNSLFGGTLEECETTIEELKLEPLAKYDADLLPIDPVERSSVRTYLKDK